MATYVNGREVFSDPRVAPVLWDDVLMPAQAVNPPGLVSDPTWDSTNVGWLFAADANKMLQLVVQLPHRYQQGGPIYPHLHWCPTTTNTGSVIWRMNYRWYNNGEALGSFSTDMDITLTPGGVANVCEIDGWGPIAKTDARISSLLDIKIMRVGLTDNYTGNVLLKEFDIHYPVDSLGSDGIGTKS